MTYFLVLYFSMSCPAPLIPQQMKPFLCQPKPEQTRTAYKKEAEKIVLGNPGARMFWCENLKCWEWKIERRTETYIGGVKI